MRLQILLTLLCFVLSSCSNNMTLPGNYDIQLFNKKQSREQSSNQENENLNNIKVVYIVPENIKSKGDLDGLFLSSRKWGRDSKKEKIISRFGSGEMQVERRVDNGVAGSGLIYFIDITNVRKDGNKIITLLPKKVESYQDGLILPFPIPHFDLETYLSSATVFHRFETISQYPENSVRANFDRLLKNYRVDYELQTPDFSSTLKVEIYPYRNGSKVIIDSKLFAMKPNNNVINVTQNIKELETRVNNIIKD